jgi:hypothetical protein
MDRKHQELCNSTPGQKRNKGAPTKKTRTISFECKTDEASESSADRTLSNNGTPIQTGTGKQPNLCCTSQLRENILACSTCLRGLRWIRFHQLGSVHETKTISRLH